MNIAKSIFGSDLERMAREGAAPLIGRGSTNPAVLAEVAFADAHNGMSRAQHTEWLAARAEERFQNDAVHDLAGEPPEGWDVRGLKPAHARYARYFYWRQGELKTLHELEANKVELERMIAAPGEAETQIINGIRRTANMLLGRANDSGETDAGALANKLAAAQHRAEAAKVALPEIERQIGRQQLRIKKLDERESEFLNAAIVEIADASGLGALYLKKIAEAREVAAMIYGLSSVVSTYGSGFGGRQTITFPRAGLPSIKDAKDGDYKINADGNAFIWESLAKSLRLNPRNAGHIPLPK